MIAACVLAAACGTGTATERDSNGEAGQRQAPAAGSIIHLKRVEIPDLNGFGRPVPVLALLAPVDWRLEGGFTWANEWRCTSDMVRADARLLSPDGRLAFQMFPAYQVDWWDDPGGRQSHAQLQATGAFVCPLHAPFTAEEFLTGVLVPAFRQGAQIVERTPAPEVAKALFEEFGPTIAATRIRSSFKADAARVRIRYGDTEEWLFASVGVVVGQAISASALMRGTMAYQNTYNTVADRVYAFRAPAGELDRYEPLASAIIGSIRFNPEWQAAVQQVQLNIARIVQEGVADRAAIIRQGQQELADMQMQGWQSRQASQDRMMTSWSQAMRGTDTYIDPTGGGAVELPAHFDSVWANGLGEYALVLSPGVNPNQALGGTWTQLKKGR
jgi:hypothetical protein